MIAAEFHSQLIVFTLIMFEKDRSGGEEWYLSTALSRVKSTCTSHCHVTRTTLAAELWFQFTSTNAKSKHISQPLQHWFIRAMNYIIWKWWGEFKEAVENYDNSEKRTNTNRFNGKNYKLILILRYQSNMLIQM